jgi:hypothetical protein
MVVWQVSQKMLKESGGVRLGEELDGNQAARKKIISSFNKRFLNKFFAVVMGFLREQDQQVLFLYFTSIMYQKGLGTLENFENKLFLYKKVGDQEV